MRAVVQRVSRAQVSVEGSVVARIETGFLVLVAAAASDSEDDAHKMADRVHGLRIFNDAEGKLNLSLAEVEGRVLALSNFTLFGEAMKSRRPSFVGAARYEQGERLFGTFVASLASKGVEVETGVFGADMQVELVNDGPVTIVLDTQTS